MIQMAEKKQSTQLTFGENLARLRKEAGYSQRALAKEVGVSYRMIAYYETETNRPPATLLPSIAKVLGINVDQLLGIKKSSLKGVNKKLLKQLEKTSQLSKPQQETVFALIDTLLEKQKKE